MSDAKTNHTVDATAPAAQAADDPAAPPGKTSKHTRVHSNDRHSTAGFGGAPLPGTVAPAGAATAAGAPTGTAAKKKNRAHRQQRSTAKRHVVVSHATHHRAEADRRLLNKDVYAIGQETAAGDDAEGSWTQDEDENDTDTTSSRSTVTHRRHAAGRVVEVIEITEDSEATVGPTPQPPPKTDKPARKEESASQQPHPQRPPMHRRRSSERRQQQQQQQQQQREERANRRALAPIEGTPTATSPSDEVSDMVSPLLSTAGKQSPASTQPGDRPHRPPPLDRANARRHSTDNTTMVRAAMARANGRHEGGPVDPDDPSMGMMRRSMTMERRSSSSSTSSLSALPFHQLHGHAPPRAAATTSVAQVTTPATGIPEMTRSLSRSSAVGTLRSHPATPNARSSRPSSPFTTTGDSTSPARPTSQPHLPSSPSVRGLAAAAGTFSYGGSASDNKHAGAPSAATQHTSFISKFIVPRTPHYSSLSMESPTLSGRPASTTPTMHRTGHHEHTEQHRSPLSASTDPQSAAMSRTQQKMLLQRQHFLSDDEKYLLHPRNQQRLASELDKARRVLASLCRSGDNPVVQSLLRVTRERRLQQQRQLEQATLARWGSGRTGGQGSPSITGGSSGRSGGPAPRRPPVSASAAESAASEARRSAARTSAV